ncbi:hypothetical protein A1QC_12465 [Vibrio rumoiensis 1S-45]|uniref:Uncharacterized protein n=2 Tax=Vibrio rumoiensis TaxID=76258 RepID=A0A1E5DZK8_9VIBR|nr:hypothetical protein A1QC_12465 [Vibrio rumoiensis 1S-45]
MRKVYLSLVISGVLVGCASTSEPEATASTATTSAPAATSTSSALGLIQDNQLTEFRSNNGKSDAWQKLADKSNGKGDVGSSKDTAFGDEGSARIRFVSENDDFTATPGLSQEVSNIEPNTDYILSLYYYDKKGPTSPSELEFGVKSKDGKTIKSTMAHAKDVAMNPQGAVKKGFKQVSVAFNSGSNTTLDIYALMHITDTSGINLDGDIGKQTEVRIDEFKLTKS